MHSSDAPTLLLQLGILLATAFLLGRLSEKAGLPATTGELAAGLVLGPSLLGGLAADAGRGWLFSPAPEQLGTLRGIALFCGVLLVGTAGASIDLGFVRSRARDVGLISVGALALPLLSTVALAPLVSSRLRGPEATSWTFAAFAGLALSVSAVPVIVKIFADLRLLHRDLSQLSVSVAVVDDATVWVGLSLVAGLTRLRQGSGFPADPGDLLFLAAAVLVLVLIGALARRTVRVRAPDRSGGAGGTGSSCLAAAALITLGAVVTDGLGLDPTLGAFLCGAVVASGRLVPVADLRPLRTVVLGVLAPLFLAVNGLAADLTALATPGLALVAALALGLAVVSKSLGAYLGGRVAGLDRRSAMAVSSALNARGTVQLVVAAAGVTLGLINAAGFAILVLVALVTSAMAGPLIRHHMRHVPPTGEEESRARLVD